MLCFSGRVSKWFLFQGLSKREDGKEWKITAVIQLEDSKCCHKYHELWKNLNKSESRFYCCGLNFFDLKVSNCDGEFIHLSIVQPKYLKYVPVCICYQAHTWPFITIKSPSLFSAHHKVFCLRLIYYSDFYFLW